MNNIPQILWLGMIVDPNPNPKGIANIIVVVGTIIDEDIIITPGKVDLEGWLPPDSSYHLMIVNL